MSLYDEAERLPGDRRDIASLGLPCDEDWKLVKPVAASRPGGRGSALWVRRLPAAFFKLTSGDMTVTTGSGPEVADLVERVAGALARGAVRFRIEGQDIRLGGNTAEARRLVREFESARAREMVRLLTEPEGRT